MGALITNQEGISQKFCTAAPFFVVGISASACDSESLIALLRNLSSDSGMAFVVTQELDSGPAGSLAQLLAKETTMPVQRAEDGMFLAANRVYVIPRKVVMTLSGHSFMAGPRSVAGSSIDRFLHSLARCHGSNAVAVILSGAGLDAASGARAISEAGGLVFAQEPAAAKFAGAPRSGSETGCADFVLPVGEISIALARIAREPKLRTPEPSEEAGSFLGREDDFQAVLDLLSSTTGIDFRFYRQATVRRRVMRRINALNQPSVADYVRHIRSTPDEVHALTQDLLMRVTHFFRDPYVFDALKQNVFPALIRRAPADAPVRIWVPGCSTGEEAYSLAMCFQEVAEAMQSRTSALVFATDINEAAIERARRGVYLDHIVADISPSRLKRFFVRKGREFRIEESLRDMCVFSRHDLLRNPPFSRVGLVSCRNVLIYLDSMREQALKRFHFALENGGYLLLGKSESVASSRDLFAPIEKAAKIYARQDFIACAEARSPRARDHSVQTGRLKRDLAAGRAGLTGSTSEPETMSAALAASNQELHRLNQELVSSKEGLEAANAELTKINEQLQVRNAELEISSEFAQATIDLIRNSLVVLASDLRVVRANQSFFQTFRLTPEEVTQRPIYDLSGGDWSNEKFQELLEQTAQRHQNLKDFELVQHLASGRTRILLLNACHFEREDRILLAMEDVTLSRRNEDELRQSQKIEAVGHLAGGLAHDFNNLLTGILCNASFALHLLPEPGAARCALEGVVAGANRAAELTKQLLACAGKSRFYLTMVNLAELVIDAANGVRASMPANVELQLDLDKYLPLVLADPSQIQQIVTNLVTNAVEAIGARGGSVSVRAGRQTVVADEPAELYRDERPAPGEYLFLEVRDNGSGMDSQTVQRIFDPFFTTKFTRPGLGLAAVLGIVRQQKGAIQLHSVPGKGSAFKVLFPARIDASSEAIELPEDLCGAGTVLVVDDEEAIRDCARAALQSYGYSVLAAEDGMDSIRIFESRFREIKLVLLDAAMPKLDGPAILQRIREISPDVPVLVSGGFGDYDIESRYYGLAFSEFFPKPYTVRQLAGKVKQWITLPHCGEARGKLN